MMSETKTIENILQYINSKKLTTPLDMTPESLKQLFVCLSEELKVNKELKLDGLGIFHLISIGANKKVSFIPSPQLKEFLGGKSIDLSQLEARHETDSNKIDFPTWEEEKLEKENSETELDSDLLKSEPTINFNDPELSAPPSHSPLVVKTSNAEREARREEFRRLREDKRRLVQEDKVNLVEEEKPEVSNIVPVQEENVAPPEKTEKTIIVPNPQKTGTKVNGKRKFESFSEESEKKQKKKSPAKIALIILISVAVLLALFFLLEHYYTKDELSNTDTITNKVNLEKEKTNIAALRNDSLITTVSVHSGSNGSNLLDISKQQYGHEAFWVYIYIENKDKIEDPLNLPMNTDIIIPPQDVKLMDPNDPKCIKKANELAVQLLN